MELTKLQLVVAKIETTNGVDANPNASTNNVPLVGQATFQPDANTVPRRIADGGFNIVSSLTSLPKGTIKFRSELRGNRTDGVTADISNGNTGNVVPEDALYQACDFARTAVAESSVGARDGLISYQLTPPSTGVGTTCTIYGYSHQKLYKFTGCKGKFSLALDAGMPGYIDWEFQGMFVPVSDSGFPGSPNFIATKPPLFQTSASRLAGVAATMAFATDFVTYNNHGLINGDLVNFRGSTTLPGNINAASWYYVVQKTTNTFKLALTRGGAAIDLITTDGSGIKLWSYPAVLWNNFDRLVVSKLGFNPGLDTQMRADANAVYGVNSFVNVNADGQWNMEAESEIEAQHPFWADWLAKTNKALIASLGDQTGNRVEIYAKTESGSQTYQDNNGRRIISVSGGIRNATPGEALGSALVIAYR